MSTPSKRRVAKREWMHKQASECNRLVAAGYADARKRIDDLTRHVPRSKTLNRPDGKQDSICIIEQFPKPGEAGEYQKYVMPEPPSPMFSYASPRVSTIDFRAVYHAIKRTSQYGDAILKWVVWEPVLDKEAERDASEVIHKLRIVQQQLHYTPGYSEALRLVSDCIDTLRSQRGDPARW